MMCPYPIIDMQATGDNIRIHRIQKGYTVLDIQKYLGLAYPQAIYHWQEGRGLPNVDHFYALSVLFNMTVNDLVVERKTEWNQ